MFPQARRGTTQLLRLYGVVPRLWAKSGPFFSSLMNTAILVFLYMVGILMLLQSWYLFFIKISGVPPTQGQQRQRQQLFSFSAFALVAGSIATASLAHILLLSLVLVSIPNSTPELVRGLSVRGARWMWAMSLAVLCEVKDLATRRRRWGFVQHFRKGGLTGELGHNTLESLRGRRAACVMPASRKHFCGLSPYAREKARHCWRCCLGAKQSFQWWRWWYILILLFPFAAILVMYVVVSVSIPRKYQHTQDIVMAMTRGIFDLILLTLVAATLLVQRTNMLFASACKCLCSSTSSSLSATSAAVAAVSTSAAAASSLVDSDSEVPSGQIDVAIVSSSIIISDCDNANGEVQEKWAEKTLLLSAETELQNRRSATLSPLGGVLAFSDIEERQQPRRPLLPGLLLLLFVLLLGLFAFFDTLVAALTFDTVAEMRATVLGDLPGRSMDFCEVEGGTLDTPALRRAWVLPRVMPRRMFNFFTGSEQCVESYSPHVAFVDEETMDMLIVSPKCPTGLLTSGGQFTSTGLVTSAAATAALTLKYNGVQPRIYVEYTLHNELSSDTSLKSPAVPIGNRAYHERLHSLYGGKSPPAGLHVHRDPVSKEIVAVEVDPASIRRVTRRPQTERERQLRARWPANDEVLEIPLGSSATVTVRCEAIEHEEYFVYPLRNPSSALLESGAGVLKESAGSTMKAEAAVTTATAPPANVVMLMLDSVSRQEVLRSLPKFSAWMRRLQHEMSASALPTAAASLLPQRRHLVLEGRGHTTMGHSTGGNWVPSLSACIALQEKDYGTPCAYHHYTQTLLFTQAKQRYGDAMETSLTAGVCEDALSVHFGGKDVNSDGFGGPVKGILDRYLYGPMCHVDYPSISSNFRGAYSAVKRCIGGMHVHEHILNYTTALLHTQLEERRRGGRYFFDVAYFMEGHEGTHAVLHLVDDALTAFLENLRDNLLFFDDPQNVLIVHSDHGSHIGPYYLSSEAGKVERALPLMLFVIHPNALDVIDARKGGRPVGTAVNIFMNRTMGFTTPVDLYLTLADLLGVTITAYSNAFMRAKWTPVSMFDSLDKKHNNALRMKGRRAIMQLTRNYSDQAAQFCHFPM